MENQREMDLVNKISTEKACMNQLLSSIKKHFTVGNFALAQERAKDLQNSLNATQEMNTELKKIRREKLHQTIKRLNYQGLKVSSVVFDESLERSGKREKR